MDEHAQQNKPAEVAEALSPGDLRASRMLREGADNADSADSAVSARGLEQRARIKWIRACPFDSVSGSAHFRAFATRIGAWIGADQGADSGSDVG